MSTHADRQGLRDRWADVAGPAIAGLVVLAAYLATLPPDLTWSHWGADGGDLAGAAASGRLPHPPGFPLYLFLARVTVAIPYGSPAGQLNLLSAAAAACTVVLVGVALQRLGTARPVAVTAALALGASSLLWSQALITEVYTTAALFATLAWLLALPGSKGEWQPGRYLGVGFVWGLAVAVHPVCIALGLLWHRLRRRELVTLGAGLLLGLLPYVALPLVGSWPQPWGDLRTVAGWWDFVTARMYWPLAFGIPLSLLPERVLAWLVLGIRQFTPLGAVAAFIGFGVSLRRERAREGVGTDLGGGALATVLVVSVYAIAYDTPDSLVYLVPFVPLCALWLGLGLEAVVRRSRWLRWAVLVLPMALAVWNASRLSLRTDAEATEWIRTTLAQAPPQAVLVTARDQHTFALWYAQQALGLREDMIVVDEDLWATQPYREWLRDRAGLEALPAEGGAAERPLCRVAERGELTCR